MVTEEEVSKLYEDFNNVQIMKVILGLIEEIQGLETKIYDLEDKLENINTPQ